MTLLSGYKTIDKKPKPDANHVECNFDSLPGQGQFCQVLPEDLIQGPCTKEKNYGYDIGKPCIIVKLNKVRSTTFSFYIFFGIVYDRACFSANGTVVNGL